MAMGAVFKAIFFCFLLLSNLSCSVYTEKQSEALSRVVYASKDSIDAARIDLADQYIVEATRIVRPPKERISIEAVYKTPTIVKPTIVVSKQKVVIIPEKYKNDEIIVVNSKEYQTLLEDKSIYNQIKLDNEEITEAKKSVDRELIRQLEYKDKIIKDMNVMQRKLVEKDLIILHRNIMIVCLFAVFGAGVYFKVKGIL